MLVLVVMCFVFEASASDPNPATVGWVSDPNTRGTLNLMFSCILTLGLCVWSAMHLNIPADDESEIQQWISGIKWGLFGVFAPELVFLLHGNSTTQQSTLN